MARKMPVQVTGGVYDDTLTNTSLEIISQQSDSEQLAKDIGYLVGRCRFFIESRNTEPRTSESIKHAEKSIKLFNDLVEHLDKMPEDMKALMSLSSDYYEKRLDAIKALAVQHTVIAKQAISTAKTWPASGGGKTKRYEQGLLSDIAQLFEDRGVMVTKAAAQARLISDAEGFKELEEKDEAGFNADTVRSDIVKYRKTHGVKM